MTYNNYQESCHSPIPHEAQVMIPRVPRVRCDLDFGRWWTLQKSRKLTHGNQVRKMLADIGKDGNLCTSGVRRWSHVCFWRWDNALRWTSCNLAIVCTLVTLVQQFAGQMDMLFLCTIQCWAVNQNSNGWSTKSHFLREDPSQPINFDEFCEMMKGRRPFPRAGS